MYDLIIVGGGPAAAAAAVYAGRKKLTTLLITESFGGQSIVSDDIQNWIGDKHISGFDLAKRLEDHVREFSDVVEVKSPEKVTEIRSIKCSVEGRICDFEVKTVSGATYESKAVILAAGARRKKLGVPGEERLNGKGVAYCSTCDAPIFADKDVAVVGGGNAGLESVIDLFPYASKIYLIVRSDTLKGDAISRDEIQKHPKVEILYNALTLEITGDSFVNGIRYLDQISKEEKSIAVQGVFVEIGSIPNSDIVKGLVDIDAFGQVIINSKHASTSHPGVFAAGDITDDPYKQNNISAGDGVKAALAAYAYLLQRDKQTPAAG
jgi:alkyl hydroperoxide reductase subunit F